MNIKIILSILLNSAVGLVLVANFFLANLLLASILILLTIAIGILSHLGFFRGEKEAK